MMRSGSGILSTGHCVINNSGCRVNAAGPVPKYQDLMLPFSSKENEYHELRVETIVSDEDSDVMRNKVVNLFVDVGVHSIDVFNIGICLFSVE